MSALDTLRAMATKPECVEVLFKELALAQGQDERLDRHINGLHSQLSDLESVTYRARKVAEDICLALQGRYWSVMAIRPSPRRSWPPVWLVIGVGHSGLCPQGWTFPRSWSAPPSSRATDGGHLEDDDLRGHRSSRAHHLQPARAGQRHHRRHSAGTGGTR